MQSRPFAVDFEGAFKDERGSWGRRKVTSLENSPPASNDRRITSIKGTWNNEGTFEYSFEMSGSGLAFWGDAKERGMWSVWDEVSFFSSLSKQKYTYEATTVPPGTRTASLRIPAAPRCPLGRHLTGKRLLASSCAIPGGVDHVVHLDAVQRPPRRGPGLRSGQPQPGASHGGDMIHMVHVVHVVHVCPVHHLRCT